MEAKRLGKEGGAGVEEAKSLYNFCQSSAFPTLDLNQSHSEKWQVLGGAQAPHWVSGMRNTPQSCFSGLSFYVSACLLIISIPDYFWSISYTSMFPKVLLSTSFTSHSIHIPFTPYPHKSLSPNQFFLLSSRATKWPLQASENNISTNELSPVLIYQCLQFQKFTPAPT